MLLAFPQRSWPPLIGDVVFVSELQRGAVIIRCTANDATITEYRRDWCESAVLPAAGGEKVR